MSFKHGSLFNGIGGFQLAAHWMGWENVFSCEIDEFCNKITKYHFPGCTQHYDIRETDFTIYNGCVDIVTGGFPCQPYSVSGERKGKEDERHLWPEMLRAIREIQPSDIVGENVRGIINWGGGLVFNEIQSDLENEGYEVLPVLLPAYAKDFDHQRYRTWFVAHARSKRLERPDTERKDIRLHQEPTSAVVSNGNVYKGDNRSRPNGKYLRRNNGVPTQLHKDGIKALGNAIVPQVAYEIFKAIESITLMGEHGREKV